MDIINKYKIAIKKVKKLNELGDNLSSHELQDKLY